MKKRNLIIYWVTTILVSFGMFFSGQVQILHSKQMVDIVSHVGYPLYFLDIIGVWKILAVIAILAPGYKLLKEWAYAGLFFAMTGAVASHLAIGDGLSEYIGPLFQTIFITLSWYFRPASRRILFSKLAQ